MMADHEVMHSSNTFSVKDEQCQEDTFVEDKVYISETAITIDNVELQDPVRHGKIKEYEKSKCLDNIKTELSSLEVTEIQNHNVKLEGGITAGDIKIKFENGLQYCEHCEEHYEDYCIKCGMLANILNKNALNSADNGAQGDIPNDILEIQDYFGQTGTYALRIIPAGVKFGPFTGLSTTQCPWKMKGKKFVLDKNKSKTLNWMQYVNPTRNTCEGNLHVFQSEDYIYYRTTRQIQVGEELLVHFGEEYGNSPDKIVRMNFVTTTNEIFKDVFACTFCCLGFSSKLHLAKHKTVCAEDTAGKFSVEELMQCPFCKIHLDRNEYFEHHMAFCCERNSRKSILSTPPGKEATTALNGRKRCLRQSYKCEQCKYRTKYQAELKEHMKQHYKVKMNKCGICNRHFKTEEILRLHVANTHAYYVGGQDDQEHSTIDYRNTHIKVEHSGSQDQKKIFKCSLCVFRAKYKQTVGRHIKTKHLKERDYKCDKCEYRTNIKIDLKRHIKSKHLKKFDFKCDSCEYRTNSKYHLEIHIKTIHLKELSFKCHSCEYRTSSKHSLEIHIKTIHLKQYDYKCDSCKYRTNSRSNLKAHRKAKHLKQFDYKCDLCECRTTNKRNLKRHIKTEHLKDYDYKCDKCQYRTNNKYNLEIHIKSKHLKEFAYNCDSCEFKTNHKHNFETHIKTKHLKKFDYNCDKCEYRTNYKHCLEIHLKKKH